MSGEDLQLEDIVLLQLFKDQIMNCGLDQVKGETNWMFTFSSLLFHQHPLRDIPATKLTFLTLKRLCQTPDPVSPLPVASHCGQTVIPWQDWLAMLDSLHKVRSDWVSGTCFSFSLSEPVSTPMQNCFKTETSLPRDLPPTRRERTGQTFIVILSLIALHT